MAMAMAALCVVLCAVYCILASVLLRVPPLKFPFLPISIPPYLHCSDPSLRCSLPPPFATPPSYPRSVHAYVPSYIIYSVFFSQLCSQIRIRTNVNKQCQAGSRLSTGSTMPETLNCILTKRTVSHFQRRGQAVRGITNELGL